MGGLRPEPAAQSRVVPVTRDQARAFIAKHHRHHGVPVGWLWIHGASFSDMLCGVASVGRPVARELNDGLSVEVTRVCTIPNLTVLDSGGERHAAPLNSMLYRASQRTAVAMGYERGLTYLLASEWDRFAPDGKRIGGAGVRGAGWHELWRVKGRSWDCESRPRTDKHPTEDKVAVGWGDWSHVAAYRRHRSPSALEAA
jgi:hypothetical protein